MKEAFVLVERRLLAETPNATFWAVLDLRCANGWRLEIDAKQIMGPPYNDNYWLPRAAKRGKR